MHVALRSPCKGFDLRRKEQNDRQSTRWRFGQHRWFLTPVRKKEKKGGDMCEAAVNESSEGEGLVSLSPVLRQLGI